MFDGIADLEAHQKSSEERMERDLRALDLLENLRAHPDAVLVRLAVERHLPSKNEAVQLLLRLLRGSP